MDAIGKSDTLRGFGRAKLVSVADWLAVTAAASLPWSTSVTGILIALWLVAFVPTVNFGDLWRLVRHPAAALPLVVCGLALAGTLWTVVSFREALGGLRGFAKLLVIALLILQFRRSGKGPMAAYAFLISCVALLALSWVLEIFPGIPWIRGGARSVPVKDYISQSAEFLLCIFGLAHLALDSWQNHRPGRALALAGLALIFFANIVFIATSRTSVMVFFSFVVIFALQRFRWKGMIGFMVAACAFAALAATLSPYLRERVAHLIVEVRDYEQSGTESSAGFRLEVWKKSARIIAQAPVAGHGTGSIEEMFRRDAVGRSGLAAVVTTNPHNQTLAIGIQLGFIGVIALFGMWSAHAMLFCRPGLAAWLGLAVVVQNIVTSLANSPIFDFGSGWIYVFGVGVFGGMILRAPGRGDLSLSTTVADRGRYRADFTPRQ